MSNHRKDTAQETPRRDPTHSERAAIRELLITSYGLAGYSRGWDDQAVAMAAGVDIRHVTRIRNAAFGPYAESYLVEDMDGDIRELETDCKAAAEALKSLANRAANLAQHHAVTAYRLGRVRAHRVAAAARLYHEPLDQVTDIED